MAFWRRSPKKKAARQDLQMLSAHYRKQKQKGKTKSVAIGNMIGNPVNFDPERVEALEFSDGTVFIDDHRDEVAQEGRKADKSPTRVQRTKVLASKTSQPAKVPSKKPKGLKSTKTGEEEQEIPKGHKKEVKKVKHCLPQTPKSPSLHAEKQSKMIKVPSSTKTSGESLPPKKQTPRTSDNKDQVVPTDCHESSQRSVAEKKPQDEELVGKEEVHSKVEANKRKPATGSIGPDNYVQAPLVMIGSSDTATSIHAPAGKHLKETYDLSTESIRRCKSLGCQGGTTAGDNASRDGAPTCTSEESSQVKPIDSQMLETQSEIGLEAALISREDSLSISSSVKDVAVEISDLNGLGTETIFHARSKDAPPAPVDDHQEAPSISSEDMSKVTYLPLTVGISRKEGVEGKTEDGSIVSSASSLTSADQSVRSDSTSREVNERTGSGLSMIKGYDRLFDAILGFRPDEEEEDPDEALLDEVILVNAPSYTDTVTNASKLTTPESLAEGPEYAQIKDQRDMVSVIRDSADDDSVSAMVAMEDEQADYAEYSRYMLGMFGV